MSTSSIDPALSLSPVRRRAQGPHAVAERLRMLLETPPGRLPWRPSFGVSLEGVVGGPSSTGRVEEARMRILAAVDTWLPEVEVVSCEVRLAEPTHVDPGDRTVPVAERALASLAVSATLEIRLVLQTDEGPLSFEADLTP